MNELIFFGHIAAVLLFVLGSLRLGKEALFCSIIILAVLANIFVLKQTFLFHLNVTCSDVLMIGSLLSLNLLQGYYGKDSAKLALSVSFFILCFFAIFSEIHLMYRSSLDSTLDPAFNAIFSPCPRILFASIFTFFVVQRIDIRIFQRLPFSFPIRSAISLIASQVLDTIMFTLLGLYGLVNNLIDIMIMSFIIKVVVIFCLTPFTAFAQRIVKVRP